jgi:hypothetical protein
MSVNSAEDNGGVISGNTAANYGGGVYVAYTSTFTMSVGTIYGSEASDPLKNTASANKGAAVYCSSTKKEEDTIYSYSYSYP